MAKINEIEKGKDTITGSFSRINKIINDDFVRAVKDSKVESAPGQSKKDIILQKLMDQYNQKGDNIFNILSSNPF